MVCYLEILQNAVITTIRFFFTTITTTTTNSLTSRRVESSFGKFSIKKVYHFYFLAGVWQTHIENGLNAVRQRTHRSFISHSCQSKFQNDWENKKTSHARVYVLLTLLMFCTLTAHGKKSTLDSQPYWLFK